MTSILAIAGAEIRAARRNHWIIATTLLLALLALTLAFLGSAPTGTIGADPLEVTVVSLSSLTIFLVPLIALLLSYDAIVGEAERGTLALLLSYPVARSEVLVGKFLGHVAVLAFATVLGYGAAASALLTVKDAVPDAESYMAFARLIASSAVLGAAFLALGYLVSAAARDRGTAAALAIAVWLLFVLLYDMALLGALVADHGKTITRTAFNVLLLFDPADVYRLFNLTGLPRISQMSGMGGLVGEAEFGRSTLETALAVWVLVPLILGMVIFKRKQL